MRGPGCVVGIALALVLSACSNSKPLIPKPATTRSTVTSPVIPTDAFDSTRAMSAPVIKPVSGTPSRKMLVPGAGPVFIPEDGLAWLYSSAASQQLLMQRGVDPSTGTRQWELLLQSQKLPYGRIHSAAHIEALPRQGVLILPSTIALGSEEMRAITRWRDQGGAVLSTWETGTHAPDGSAQGDGFMRNVLGLETDRNTYSDPAYAYLVNRGPSAVLHHLPASARIFMQRQPQLAYLRLKGGQVAADMSHWSRPTPSNAKAGAIVFQERPALEGGTSRLVALGYPEQSWQRMDPDAFQAIHTDILHWLLRKPEVSLAAWPAPYEGALATYHHGSLPENIQKWLAGQKIPSTPMRPLPSSSKHTDASFYHPRLRKAVPASYVQLPVQDSQGLTPVNPTPTPYALISSDIEDTRHPLFLGRTADSIPDVIALPTLSVPVVKLLHTHASATALRHLHLDLQLATHASAVSLLDISDVSTSDIPALGSLAQALRELRKTTWIASTDEIAAWWKQRSLVQARLLESGGYHTLEVQNAGAGALDHPIQLLLTLPAPNANVSFASPSIMGVSVHPLDPWSVNVAIAHLPAGVTRINIAIAHGTSAAPQRALELKP